MNLASHDSDCGNFAHVPLRNVCLPENIPNLDSRQYSMRADVLIMMKAVSSGVLVEQIVSFLHASYFFFTFVSRDHGEPDNGCSQWHIWYPSK